MHTHDTRHTTHNMHTRAFTHTTQRIKQYTTAHWNPTAPNTHSGTACLWQAQKINHAQAAKQCGSAASSDPVNGGMRGQQFVTSQCHIWPPSSHTFPYKVMPTLKMERLQTAYHSQVLWHIPLHGCLPLPLMQAAVGCRNVWTSFSSVLAGSSLRCLDNLKQ